MSLFEKDSVKAIVRILTTSSRNHKLMCLADQFKNIIDMKLKVVQKCVSL